jgi:ParB-like chromosome segregation protein Spo0J
MQIQLRDPKTLRPNPWNTNAVGPENMKKLANSIRELGFVSAVVVRELPNGELQILGGQHRVETACDMGLTEVPTLNLGIISDVKAKKIGLIDNSRYGVDDTISLAKLYEEIGMSASELAEFLPFSEQDFETISRAVDIDIDNLDLDDDDADGLAEETAKRPEKTHDILRFRVSLGDAERIRQMIETTIKSERLQDDDDLTAAGSALAILLITAGA